MIPVLIGAAVGLTGVALFSGDDDKSSQSPETEKRQVSEDYVMRQLNRAGKNLQNNSAEPLRSSGFVCSNSFNKDFKRIDDFLVDSTVSDEYIADALNKIERRAKTHRNNTALNFVNSYREKLRYRNGAQGDTSDFGADFERIDNMIADTSCSYTTIKNELESIKWRAQNRRDEKALNFVDYYQEKLRNRNGAQEVTSYFSADFKRIDNMLSSGFDAYSVKNELQLIERRAKNRRDVAAMNIVANYYERIGHYQKAWHCRETLKTF